ncbi:hypothetical protein HY464_01345 [Candidatus Peregrinibacteria bacterium]|nr:hypothetical protein [Candidatus Peregrinibacteria bacterium]MBI2524000.1 hypothetical protein [Candidatus Peregrinibacteria bacterium]MBI4129318.1 hypothetical protein [Candidatus Peregrinibacteria bacterium]
MKEKHIWYVLRMEGISSNASHENVRLVDAYLIRNHLDTDFNILHRGSSDWNTYSPKYYIPKNEIWVDHCFADEIDFLLASDRIIDSLQVESRAALITALRTIGFLRGEPPPPFITQREKHGPLEIAMVDGKIVREYLDPEFVLGGHDLVYNYIPKNEVWVEGKMDPREIPFVLEHELEERKRMDTEGLTYDIAHECALVAERILRRKEGAAFPGERAYPFYGLSSQEIIRKFSVAEQPLKRRPVVVEHCTQNKSMCGPASLKIALSAFGKHATEEELSTLANTSIEHGTEHEGLVRAARHFSATVIEKEKGTLGEIERLVKQEHLPVIVGWFDEDDDHYCVVTDVTTECLVLADPAWDCPERFVRKEHFEKTWFDFVGPESAITSWRWYMAVSFPHMPPIAI